MILQLNNSRMIRSFCNWSFSVSLLPILLFAPATDSPWLSPAPSTKPKRGPHPHPAGRPSGGTLLLRFAPSGVCPAGESFRGTLTHPFLTCGSSGISSPVLRSGHSLAGPFRTGSFVPDAPEFFQGMR